MGLILRCIWFRVEGFPENRRTLSKLMKTRVFWSLYWGRIMLRNCHIGSSNPKVSSPKGDCGVPTRLLSFVPYRMLVHKFLVWRLE